MYVETEKKKYLHYLLVLKGKVTPGRIMGAQPNPLNEKTDNHTDLVSEWRKSHFRGILNIFKRADVPGPNLKALGTRFPGP